jgi:amidohydrolase
MQCEGKITWIMSDPPLMNDPFVTRLVFDTAQKNLPNHSIDQNYQSMGSEDMALIQKKIPGCYIYIGSANAEKGLNFGHHHPKFNFDEIVLSQAAALICASAIDLLNQA